MSSNNRPITIYAVAIWLLALSFYVYEFFLSIFLGSIAKDVMVDLHINTEQFAVISAAYFYVYSLMQTPVGLIADRFGVRKVLTVACALCALGAFWFAMSHHYLISVMARVLIGFGSSFGFVSALVLILNWFDQKHFGLFSGLTQFFASVGGVVAGGPLVMIVAYFHGDWRLVMMGIAAIGGLLALAIGTFVRNKPKRSDKEVVMITPRIPLRRQLSLVFMTKGIWYVVLFAAFNYVTLPLLGAYWGTLFLQARGMSQGISATIVSMIWLGMAFGCPFLTRFSDYIKRRKMVMVFASFLGVVITCVVLYFPFLPASALFVMFFLIGVAGAGQSVSYPTITEYVSDEARPAALGLNNSFLVFFGGLFPSIVGSVITYLNPDKGTVHSQIPASAYTEALVAMPIFFSIAGLLALFGIKETFGRPQQKVHHVNID
ncbi:MAG: hypothetical protein S4CHLAM102_11630 [Chlamydiia bacterium]|nr:hypothetical protein [Chlamydiia bacterium]